MTSLIQLAAEYRAVALQLSDMDMDAQTIADTLESIAEPLEQKAQSVGHMVRVFEADAAACKAWAKTATERAKSLETRAESLRDYLATNMQATGMQRITGPGIALSFRASSAVVIDGVDLIPAQYMRQPDTPPPEPNKAAIAAALKAGESVPGAHIEQRQNLTIK